MRVAVAGGSGVVGRLVVAELARGGHDPVVVARSAGVDLLTGAGLEGALTGCTAVVDVSNVATTSARRSRAFFASATRRLLDAAADARVEHVLLLSIVGVDEVDLGYYQGKRLQEQLVRRSPLPWTVLRATQFLEFPGQVLDRSSGPVALVPRMRSQPVAAREVAAHLVSLLAQPPAGDAVAIAGPEQHEVVDLARELLEARGSHRRVVPVRLPGAVGRGLAGGMLLPAAST
ncbi:uncharacterized protein YbjT (DUF2867 family) [Motilibacter peucedani]|uniref:Uncharacterized protein YbjT (DUF2867 family) n=1 Tax=Motilibacter peucedani TaxID=598650 RepID=A0A420XPQ9_9ACTN|nr:NAD(P)H-binding protein [Motilibacter peucedani]RKS75271.1 uncharacterized protein YbjT (DUF2867 family) [Motilibacter peucedani]